MPFRPIRRDKHFLSSGFRPVVGQATMRMVLGEIERNKLPFHADQSRPWLEGTAADRQVINPFNGPQVDPAPFQDLPESVRRPRSLQEASNAKTPQVPVAPVAPIVFDLVGQKVAEGFADSQEG